MRRVLVLCALLVACRRTSSSPNIAADPARAEAGPPKEAPSPERSLALSLHHGKVIDLEKRAVTFVLEKDLTQREASFGDDAYLVTKAGELRAYSMTTGVMRWSTPGVAGAAGGCSVLAAAAGGAFCGKGSTLTLHDAKTGAARVITTTSTADIQQLITVENDRAIVRRLPDHVLSLRTDRTLESYDGTTGATAGSATFPFMPWGFRAGLVSTPAGVCGAGSAASEVQAACVDATTKIVWSKSFTLRKPSDPTTGSFMVRQLDDRFLVVSTWWSPTLRRGIAVRITDGVEVARIEAELAAAVSDRSGGLEGLLVTTPTVRFLEPSGALRWTSTEKLDEAASAVLIDSTLAVASFGRIATGAELHGFDNVTGKTIWRGDVELLPISHSKYYNEVALGVAFGHLIMNGREAAQSYVEIFDVTTGVRKLADVRALW